MQKTLTIRGKTYTGKQVAALMSERNMTNGEDYIIELNGDKYYANYRQIQDPPYAPVCNKAKADAISLMSDDGSFKWSIWLSL